MTEVRAGKKQYFQVPELRDMSHELYHRGGPFRKAGERVLALITLITNKDEKPLEGWKITGNGESRIDRCVKYQLPGACRLVTVQEKGKIILLFVGDHESEEKWLNANRGAKFVVDKDSKLDEIRVISETLTEDDKPEICSEYSKGQLYEALSNSEYEDLVDGTSRSVTRELEKLHSFSSDEDMFGAIEDIKDESQKSLILDVFVSLKEGDVAEARRRIAFEKGELVELTDDAVEASERIYEIPDNDPAYAELFEHFVKTADYKKWMLFMHPEQQEMVDKDFKGSAKLLGVSGSGKTCVVIKRAVRLAIKYPDIKVLVVTLNRSLAILIDELVQCVADENIINRIEVKPFFKVCQEHLLDFEPQNKKLYDDKTWKSNEHIDEIWTEFYRCELNFHEASVLVPVHDYLIGQGINAQQYIREEFDWIRSAIPFDERASYSSIERQGRSISMSKPHRQHLLDGLTAWESKMRAIGVTDYLGLAVALAKHEEKIQPKYGCVIIDESQDFGTTEMELIRRLVPENENDILVCGDAAQRVSSKFQSLRKAGIKVASKNTKKLLKNYRNSKEILSAAYSILDINLSEEMISSEDFEVLYPEYSSISGASPLILKANSLQEEINYSIAYANNEVKDNPNSKVCIAVAGYSLYEISVFSKICGIKVLDGETSIASGNIFLSDLEQTKGFEFDTMIVLNVCDHTIPNPKLPEKEHYRELSHLYVAMTRAKLELIVSYHGSLSLFLSGSGDFFIEEAWSVYCDSNEQSFISPERLDFIRNESSDASDILYMSGPEFLYTEEAIGLEISLIKKVRDLVPGHAINRGGHMVQWKNIGSAYESVRNEVRSRQVFGPEGLKGFYMLTDSLDVPSLVKGVSKQSLYVGRVNSEDKEFSDENLG